MSSVPDGGGASAEDVVVDEGGALPEDGLVDEGGALASDCVVEARGAPVVVLEPPGWAAVAAVPSREGGRAGGGSQKGSPGWLRR